MRMPWRIVSGGLVLLLSVLCAPRGVCASYTITATDVTMPVSGNGVSSFTVTNIPITGTVVLNCGYAGTLALGNLPVCPLTPPHAYSVNAGGTLTGTVTFYPPDVAVPASVPAAGFAVGAALLLGLRRRMRRWLAPLCVLALLAGIGACGGRSRLVMPPGTYPYSLGATNCPAAGEGPCILTSTILRVTVP